MMELMQHEKEAADIIAYKPRVLLFDAMGTGKTVSVLEGFKRACNNFVGVYKCIICAPNTILGQWEDEISRWLCGLGERNYGVKCVTALGPKETREMKYEYFKSVDSSVFLLTNYLFLVKDDFFKGLKGYSIILDEGYFLRNKRTKAHQFLKTFLLDCNKVVVLSGNADSFTDQQFYDLVELVFPGEVEKGDKNAVIAELGNSYISRDLGSVFDIQSPEIVPICQELSTDQKRLLSFVAMEESRAMKTSNYNARVFYGKMISVLQSPRVMDPALVLSPKELFLQEKLKTITGKCVVYCPDKKFFKVVKSDLNSFGVNAVTVSGEMPIYIRERNLRLFQSDPSIPCLLISGVGKFGLNLQIANTLICMGVPKGKFDLEQLIGRLNRINQTEKVFCYIPYHKDSLEEKLVKSLL